MIQASWFSKTSFLKWVATGIFRVRGAAVKMDGYRQEVFKPPKSCQVCKRTWDESGLEAAIRDVDWNAFDDALRVVWFTVLYSDVQSVCVCVCVCGGN